LLTVSDALNKWKEDDGKKEPIVTLIDIVIHPALTVYLMAGNPNGQGSFLYDGRSYQAAAIRLEDLAQTLEGDLRPRKLAISNIDGIPGSYIERFDLDGNLVTIRRVLLHNPSTVPGEFFIDEATIQDQFFDRKEAVVELGWASLFRKNVPSKRYIRNKCQQDWENRFDVENGCNFPSDQFSEDTEQDFIAGAQGVGEQERKYGWFTKNATNAFSFNVSMIFPDFLYIDSTKDGIEWSGTERTGPYCYKKISGDFEVYTQVDPQFFRPGGTFGILCQEDTFEGDSFIALGRTRGEGDPISIVVNASIDGSVEPSAEVLNPVPSYVKLKRVGNVFSSYYSLTENSNWIHIEDRTIAITPEVNIGLFLSGGGQAIFPYFRFLSGGPDICDRTRDGVDGCRKKRNVHRIFVFNTPRK